MTALALGSMCTGYGGLDLAIAQVLDVRPAWVADPDPGAAAILAHHHPTVPNLGDLTAVDWTAVEPVDVLCAGYPCQPFSAAGKRKGTADARHLWPHIAAALRVLRPRLAIFENVANHLRLGFADVLADLARLGFDAEWCVAGASEVGAPHRRRRLFVVAVAADADHLGGDRTAAQHRPHGREVAARDAAADAQGARREGPRSEPARRRPERGGRTAADSDRIASGDHCELPAGRHSLQQRVRDDAPRCHEAAAAVVDWGDYAPAINRWARILGRPAPPPRLPTGRDGADQLNPAFVEWLMGLDEGHVTAVPGLTRNQQLHALGNGVVPAQGAAAIAHLLDRIEVAA